MIRKFSCAPLLMLACTAAASAQQFQSMPPIVSSSTARMQQSATYTPSNAVSYDNTATPGNVYTPVAPMMGSATPTYSGAPLSAGSGDYGCDSGCGAGCGDCGDCGFCDRYVSFFGGWNGLLDYNNQFQGFQVNGTFDDGYGAGGAIGRQISPRLRTELEFAYRYNEGEEATLSGGQTAPVAITEPLNGEIECYSGMVNVLCDFGGRTLGRITPYAGVGAGVGFVEADVQANIFPFAIDDSAFAYQGIAGLLFPMGQRADWFCEYRYFGTDDLYVQNLTDGSFSQYEYRAHNIFFGIRFCR
jgi:opacity protein-like surface antigen